MRMLRRNATNVAAMGPRPKTYADFQAHIATLAVSGATTWAATSIAPGTYRVTAAAGTGSMNGSPWLSRFAGWTVARMVQHALPSEAVFNAQVAAGREVLFRNLSSGSAATPSLARNGYTSGTGGTSATGCDLLLYWDGTQAQQMNPLTGTGPTPYTW